MINALSQITVYRNDGTQLAVFPVTDNCERNATLRGDDYVKLSFHLEGNAASRIDIPAFAFVVYDGQIFFNRELYRPVPKGTYYDYEIKFVSFANMLNKMTCFRHVVVGNETFDEPQIDMNGTLVDIATIVVDSIHAAAARYAGKFAALMNSVSVVSSEINANTTLETYGFKSAKVKDVLEDIANKYEIDYWFEMTGSALSNPSMKLHFCKCERTDLDMLVVSDEVQTNNNPRKRSTSKGLLDCNYSQDWSGVTQRLMPFGSERNIERKQAIVNNMFVSYGKRLRLHYDHSCVVSGQTIQHAYKVKTAQGQDYALQVDARGAVSVQGITTGEEETREYDDIYPRGHMRVVHVTQRGTDNPIYTVYAKPTELRSGTWHDLTDAEIDALQADANKKLFPIVIEEGNTLSIAFESGYLNGREFEVADRSAKMSWNNTTQKYEVDPTSGHWLAVFDIVPEGDNDESAQLPFGNFVPRAKETSAGGYEGDMFAMFNMVMPAYYVESAENELAQQAYDDIEDMKTTRPEVKCTGDPEFFASHIMFIGQRVAVTSELFGTDTFVSRVTNFSHSLTKPNNVSFKLCSSHVTGALTEIHAEIADHTSDIQGVQQSAKNISRRGFRDALEMKDMLETLAAEMMLVGVEKNQFAFTMGIECVDTQTPYTKFSQLNITAGSIQHTQEPYVKDDSAGLYTVQATTLNKDVNGNNLVATTPYYMYAHINASAGTATMELHAAKNDGSDYLLLGILSSEFDDTYGDTHTSQRVFNRSNGYTQITGGTITTEQIQDPTRSMIIDMSSNPPRIIAKNGAQIIGKIQFLSSNGTAKDVADEFNDVEEAVSAAETSAAAASAAAAAASAEVANVTDDGIISKGTEKYTIKKEWQQIAGENMLGTENGSYKVTTDQATSYGLTFSALTTAFNSLNTAMVAVLANMNTDYLLSSGSSTFNTKDKFNGLWKTYYDAEIALLNEVADVIDTKEIGGPNLIGESNPVGVPITVRDQFYRLLVGDRGEYNVNKEFLKKGTKYVFTFSNSECEDANITEFTAELWDDNVEEVISSKVFTIGQGGKWVFETPSNRNALCFIISGEAVSPEQVNGMLIYDAMLQEGDKSTSYQEYVKHLTASFEAAARAGSTDIDGGLVMTSLLKLRNESGVVTAGMSGLSGTSSIPENVLLWGGATYAQALNAALHDYYKSGTSGELIQTLLKKDGTGKIGCFRVVDGSTVKVIAGENEIIITTQSISSYISNFATKEYDVYGSNSVQNSTTHNKDFNLCSQFQAPAGKFKLKLPSLTLSFSTSVRQPSSMTDFSWSNLTIYHIDLVVKDSSDSTVQTIRLYSNEISLSGSESQTINISGREIDSTLTSSRQLKFALRFNCKGNYHAATGGAASNEIEFYTTSEDEKLTFKELKRVTVFGNDGIAVSVDSSSTFFVYNNGTNMDIRISGLPTSSASLPKGKLWNDSGTLKIKT